LLTLDSPGSVTLNAAAIDFTGFLGVSSALRGHFLSSDNLLNRIWYAGVYTLNLNQIIPGTSPMPGELDQSPVLIDGAKRDRAVWSGDQLIADPTAYYSIDPRYVRASLALFGAHPATLANEYAPAVGDPSQPGPLPGECSPNTQGFDPCISWSASYSMDFVPALYDYYLYTGDASFIRQEWPMVARQMAWDAEQVDANGLVSVNDSDNADWAGNNPSGELTYVNSVYYKALNAAAELADAIGQPGSRTYRAAAAAIKAAVNAQLWDAKLGIYDASTSNRGPIVQDANVFAVLSGIAAPARARGLMGLLERALASHYGTLDVSSPVPSGYSQIVSPFIGGFQLAADFQSNRTAAALALMRTEWGWMVEHDPGGTDWEKIELGGVPSALDSTAHAWGTGATSALSQYVLGVTPATAGYATWTVVPHPGDVHWTEGSVPTPHGLIDVSWRQGTAGSSFRLTLSAPHGTSGSVWVPIAGSPRMITRDGRVVWRHGVAVRGARAHTEGGYVVFERQAGSHTYAWSTSGKR
jgi:alpha-L-rhamnosidase